MSMENKVGEVRRAIGLSQEKLAEQVGITRPYLSDIERNKRNPTGPVLLKIAQALNMQIEELFFSPSVHQGE